MTMNIGRISIILEELAQEAGQPVDKFMKTAAVIERYQEKLHLARAASDEDKAKIDAYLGTLNGGLTEDVTPLDILRQAGVVRKQGTSSYASWQKKQLLLTHQPHQTN